MCAMGFNDSKQLDEGAREKLFTRMLRTPRLGWYGERTGCLPCPALRDLCEVASGRRP